MRTLLADLDGTLIDTNRQFWDAKAEIARRATVAAGISRETMRTYLDEATRADFAAGRTLPAQFGARLARAYTAALAAVRGAPRPDDLAWCAAQGPRLATAVYPPFPGVHALLAAARARGIRLGIVTKGADEALQRRKLADAHLLDAVDDILVVRLKDASAWQTLRHRLGATGPMTPDNTVIVGDSLADDIVPAHSLGATAVWVAPPPGFWVHERATPAVPPHVTLAAIGDLPHHLPHWVGPACVAIPGPGRPLVR